MTKPLCLPFTVRYEQDAFDRTKQSGLSMFKANFAAWPRSTHFWLLCAFLVFVFLTGGSARNDAQSLAVLRPVSATMLGVALCILNLEHIRAHKWLVTAALTVISLVLLQLLPLSDGVRYLMSGNNLVEDIARTTLTADTMRPISIAPLMTTNAIFALMTPLAVMILGIQLSREERFALLPVVITLALLSGLLGFLQALGSPGGILYLYQITNTESAVGLFANRNHQATLLAMLFPMLAVFASANIGSKDQGRIKSIAAISLAAVLVPLILVTGSRSGLLIGLIGIISALFLYKPRSSDRVKKAKGYRLNPLYLLAALSVIALSALSILFSRAQAVQRLSGLDQDDDLRFKIWQPIIEIAANFLPAGSGAGTFSSTYQVYEARAQLGPTIVNQAHNDWLDYVLTTGYPGMVVVALAGIGFLNLAWQALRNPMKAGRSLQFSRLGAVIIFLVVIAALVDYALRTPIIAAVFVISLIWLKSILEDRSSHKKFSNGVSVSQVS